MFIELHLTTNDPEVLRAMVRMGYVAAASTTRVRDEEDSGLLVMRKVQGPRRGGWGQFTVSYVVGNNRYALNKYITNDRVDVVTILPGREYPSRRQLAIMEGEGKYIELVLLPFLRMGLLNDLVKVASDVMDYSTRAVLSLGVGSMNDLKNPMDAAALLGMLTGDRGYWVRAVKDNPMALVVDSIYRSGVCS